MTFDLYFNLSRTAVEIIAIAAMTAAIAYVVKDMIDDEKMEAEPDFLK